MEKEYILFCDESEKKGKYFSNFYGGVIVGASKVESVVHRLNQAKNLAGINSEAKWEKTANYELPRYKKLVEAYFHEIKEGNIRVRIIFRANSQVPTGLTKEQRRDEYYILYYQFLKHGFGLASIPVHSNGVRLRIYLDKLPNQSKVRTNQFRNYLIGLAEVSEIRRTGLIMSQENITEVDSRKHILLQCTDIVLGSMAFKLNDKHKAIPEGANRRVKRTIAKEKLYKYIRSQIGNVTGKPNFNIGSSTGVSGQPQGRWSSPLFTLEVCAKES